jgi:hypothetical protein
MEKDKLVYSTEKKVELTLDEARIAMQRATDAHDQRKFEQILIALGVDPDSRSFQARVESFRKNCNMD